MVEISLHHLCLALQGEKTTQYVLRKLLLAIKYIPRSSNNKKYIDFDDMDA